MTLGPELKILEENSLKFISKSSLEKWNDSERSSHPCALPLFIKIFSSLVLSSFLRSKNLKCIVIVREWRTYIVLFFLFSRGRQWSSGLSKFFHEFRATPKNISLMFHIWTKEWISLKNLAKKRQLQSFCQNLIFLNERMNLLWSIDHSKSKLIVFVYFWS